MKDFVRKLFAAAVACTFAFSAASCSDKNEESDPLAGVSIDQEDMPYGATLTQLKPKSTDKVKISVDYDYRFLTEEEAIKLSNYVAALNNADGALMEQTVYPAYLEYLCAQNGSQTTEDYLKAMIENLETNVIGAGFDFNYVATYDCLDESYTDSETGFSTLDAQLARITGEDHSSRITSRKLVSFDIMYAVDDVEGSYSLKHRTGSDSMLYIYTIDGQVYIL